MLPAAFYARDTTRVARDLLGCRILRATEAGVLRATIVETEAYVGQMDRACHAARGRPDGRTRAMYGPAGAAYLYLIYGQHWCLNVVTEAVGFPAAVLIRGVRDEDTGAIVSGPGRVGRYLSIDGALYGHALNLPPLSIEGRCFAAPMIRRGPRVGVAYAGEWASRPWRFWIDGTVRTEPRKRARAPRS